jgi:hypothetical protein
VLKAALVGIGIASTLLLFEYLSVRSASRQRAQRRHLKVTELDQSEIARLRNLSWFCFQLPFICAGIAWLLE